MKNFGLIVGVSSFSVSSSLPSYILFLDHYNKVVCAGIGGMLECNKAII